MTEPDIASALEASPGARARYEALPPSHQAEYLKWIGEAKREATRARRIQGMIARLGEEPAFSPRP
jgi:uncharacterized protein YdeI (YjbR/CyaY-like superfamily)